MSKYKCETCGQIIDEESIVQKKLYSGTYTSYCMQVDSSEYVNICPHCESEMDMADEYEECEQCGEAFIKVQLGDKSLEMYCEKCRKEEEK